MYGIVKEKTKTKLNFRETENQTVVARGWGKQEMERWRSEYTHFQFQGKFQGANVQHGDRN